MDDKTPDDPNEESVPGVEDANHASGDSPSKAPETGAEALEASPYFDMRLIPGGRLGASVDIGINAMARADVPSGAREMGQARYGDSPGGGQ